MNPSAFLVQELDKKRRELQKRTKKLLDDVGLKDKVTANQFFLIEDALTSVYIWGVVDALGEGRDREKAREIAEVTDSIRRLERLGAKTELLDDTLTIYPEIVPLEIVEAFGGRINRNAPSMLVVIKT